MKNNINKFKSGKPAPCNYGAYDYVDDWGDDD